MNTIDRTIFFAIALALWLIVLGDGWSADAANVQIQERRLASEIIHGIVDKAIKGDSAQVFGDYDELEARIQDIVETAFRSIPMDRLKPSRQDIASAVGSCRIAGRVHLISGQLDGRLSC